MPFKNKKISFEEKPKSRVIPFTYQHRYRCTLYNKYSTDDIDYIMHCDYADPRSSKSITELKHRLSWSYSGCKLERIHVIGSKKVCSGYLYESKRRKYEAE
jgi:hypothetical protein